MTHHHTKLYQTSHNGSPSFIVLN